MVQNCVISYLMWCVWCMNDLWILCTESHCCFCSVLFCSVLFCSVLLFCSALFCSVLFCSLLFWVCLILYNYYTSVLLIAINIQHYYTVEAVLSCVILGLILPVLRILPVLLIMVEQEHAISEHLVSAQIQPQNLSLSVVQKNRWSALLLQSLQGGVGTGEARRRSPDKHPDLLHGRRGRGHPGSFALFDKEAKQYHPIKDRFKDHFMPQRNVNSRKQ